MNVRVQQLATYTLVGVKSILFMVCNFDWVASMCADFHFESLRAVDREGQTGCKLFTGISVQPCHPVYLHATHKDGRL